MPWCCWMNGRMLVGRLYSLASSTPSFTWPMMISSETLGDRLMWRFAPPVWFSMK